MERGIIELRKYNIDVMNIYNNDNLEENVEKVVSYVVITGGRYEKIYSI